MKRLIIILVFSIPLRAQVIEVKGGDSSLFNAAGGGITLHLGKSESEVGLGLSNGQLRVGGAERFTFRDWDATLGDRNFSPMLGNVSLYLNVRGLTLTRDAPRQSLTLFTGATGQTFALPFFLAATGQHLGAGLYYRWKPFHAQERFTLASLAVTAGSRRTLLQDVAYHYGSLDLGGGGGVLENHSLTQGRLTYHWQDHLAVVATHQGYRNITTDVISGATRLGPWDAYASRFGGTRHGEAYGSGLRLWLLQFNASYLRSGYGSAVTYGVGERLGQRLILRQFLNTSNGHRTLAYGGGFRTNLFTVSVDYQDFFVPERRGSPFQQALMATLALQLPHSTSANIQTGLNPNGAWKWGAYGATFVGSTLREATHAMPKMGSRIIEGTVLDEQNEPIAGAALRIGKDLVFTDSSGHFFLRVKKDRPLSLVIVPTEFTQPGTWKVVQCPVNAVPDLPVRIIVRRQSGVDRRREKGRCCCEKNY